LGENGNRCGKGSGNDNSLNKGLHGYTSRRCLSGYEQRVRNATTTV
jgi:hypothetical protein